LHKKKILEENSVGVATVTPSSRNKRDLEYDSTDDWTRKTNLPPHLTGLIQKVSKMIADDIQISAQYYKKISDEAALQNAVVGKGPLTKSSGGKFASALKRLLAVRKFLISTSTYVSTSHPIIDILEGDVVGGTEKYTKVLFELFYQLKNHPGAAANWLASMGFDDDEQTNNQEQEQQQSSASVADIIEKQRVAVEVLPEEAAEAAGLL
jgi:hypothetical protein